MQTHHDDQHADDFTSRLRERAAKAQRDGTAGITAGKQGEVELANWKGSNGVHVSHMPDDEQGVLRISIGGGDHLPVTLNYLTVRGPVGQCIDLMEKALVALRECPE